MHRPGRSPSSICPGRPGALAPILVISLVLLSLSPATVSAAGVDAEYLGSAPGRFDSIKCQDIDGDGNVEIVFGNTEGHLGILEATGGAYVSEYQSGELGHRLWGVEIGDPDQDGDLEIVAGGQGGQGGEGLILMMDATTREIEWRAQGEVEDPTGGTMGLVRDLHGIAIADPDMDGETEILVGSGYKTDNPWSYIYIFHGRTHRLETAIGPVDSRMRGVEVEDVDGDGRVEVIFGSGVALGEQPGEGYIRIYEYDDASEEYRIDWKGPDMNGDVQGMEVEDVDGDGHLEIIVTTGYRYREGYVYVLRHLPSGAGGVGQPDSYEILWQSDDVGPKPYALDVGDIDDDGVMEIVTGNQPGYIWVFDGVTHRVEWKSELLGTDVFGLDLADVDGDGRVEIVAAQGGYVGKADWTSGYSTPHIYIIDGRTHTIEVALGEPDYLEIVLQVAVLVVVIITLLNLNRYLRRRHRARTGERDYRDKISRRRGVRTPGRRGPG